MPDVNHEILPGVTSPDGWQEGQDYEAMKALAALSGDVYAASRYLLDCEHLIYEPDQLLAMRRGTHRAVYDRLQDELSPMIEEQLVREMREVAGRALAIEAKLLSRIEKQLSDKDMADPARALMAVTKTKQIAIDKVLSMTGRPSTITESRDAREIVKKLEAMRVLVPLDPVIDASAEDEA